MKWRVWSGTARLQLQKGFSMRTRKVDAFMLSYLKGYTIHKLDVRFLKLAHLLG